MIAYSPQRGGRPQPPPFSDPLFSPLSDASLETILSTANDLRTRIFAEQGRRLRVRERERERAGESHDERHA